MKPLVSISFFVLFLLGFPSSADAHEPGFRTARIRLGDSLALEMEMTADDWEQLGLPLEVDTAPGSLGLADLQPLMVVSQANQPLVPSQVSLTPDEDHWWLRLSYPWESEAPVRLSFEILDHVAHGAKIHALVANPDGEVQSNCLLDASHRELEIIGSTNAANSWLPFLRSGAEHVWIGIDHLLFLTVLLISCRKLSSMLRLVTTFTIAHSLTLVAAVQGWVSCPPSIVEPLIAASIVVMALRALRGSRPTEAPENLTWVFAFGLFHGLGFAGALMESSGSEGRPWGPLLWFNVGVEMGQLSFGVVVVGLGAAARHLAPRAVSWSPAVLVVSALAGSWWLVDRTLLS